MGTKHFGTTRFRWKTSAKIIKASTSKSTTTPCTKLKAISPTNATAMPISLESGSSISRNWVPRRNLPNKRSPFHFAIPTISNPLPLRSSSDKQASPTKKAIQLAPFNSQSTKKSQQACQLGHQESPKLLHHRCHRISLQSGSHRLSKQTALCLCRIAVRFTPTNSLNSSRLQMEDY